jgi:hypothetical protein
LSVGICVSQFFSVNTSSQSSIETNQFIVHVHNHHGNEKTEKSRGQTAVKPDNFEAIAEITASADYVMVGARLKTEHGLKDEIIYAKIFNDKTFIYSEEILSGKRNKALSGSTLFIKDTVLKEQSLYNTIRNNRENDITKAKIIGRVGGQTDSEVSNNTRATVAASAQSANT